MSDSLRYVKLADTVATAPQIRASDVPAIAAAGYRVLINNRPAFNYPGDDVGKMAALFDDPERPVFAFCRSGTRSCNLWITTRPDDARDEARRHAQQLGFDVSMSLR